MKRPLAGLMLVCAVLLGQTAIGQNRGPDRGVRRVARPLANHYIVVLADDQDPDAMARESEAVHMGRLGHTYRAAFKGYSMRLTAVAAGRLARDPRVAYVEEDGIVQVTQAPTPWGLDRVDQRWLPLDGSYSAEALGTGVSVHVIDTGIRASHAEFGGRAFVFADYVDDDGDGDPLDVANDDAVPSVLDGADCNGHGTHVAGTIGGATYGVARNVTLYAHRVLTCSGAGATSSVIAAINAVTADPHRPALVNMSLGGDPSDVMDQALRQSIASGITYVVAAGNSNADAQTASPARVGEAITVGATSSADARASFSNFGAVLDLFAPGVSINSAWFTSDTAVAQLSGTSMAAPHVTGVVAQYLEVHPEWTPIEVHDALVTAATPNVVTSPGAATPNLLLHSSLAHASAPAVDLLTPNGGEKVFGNKPFTIVWAASDPDGFERFDVQLSVDGGVTYLPVPECAVGGAERQCVWLAPNPVTATARIRVVGRDSGGDEGLDQSAANFSIVIKPDLVVTAVSTPSPPVFPGGSFSVNDTVRNVGNADAGGSVVRYYLSLDAAKSADDVRLAATRTVPLLAAETESAGTASLTVVSTTNPGTYALFACADDTALVAEASDANNCAASPTPVTVALADLVETGLSSSPGVIIPGAALSVTDTVSNSSLVTAGASSTRYYLSADNARNVGDMLLTGTRAVPAMAPGASLVATRSVTVPATAVQGTYFVLACADDLLKVREASEANNCVASAGTVLVAFPDLIETTVSSPPVVAAPGAAFNVTDGVSNAGPATAAASTTRYFLSADAVKDAADVLLTGTRSVASLAAGVTVTATRSVTIPTTMPNGTYRVLACADDLAKVKESNEANNCVASAGVVLVALPDLVESAISNPPATAIPGTAFSVTDTVRNTGVAAATASSTRYYLSADALKNAGDVLLTGSRSVASLAPGAAVTATRSVTIPAATPTGAYRLLACADDLVRVQESDETNNCSASATAMLLAFPDLVETAISNPPATAVPGASFSVTDTVSNAGQVTAGSSSTRYYLSADATKDAGDILLTGTRNVASLLPGAIVSAAQSVTVPSTAALGTYRVLACADDALVVTEQDETNNCVASAGAVLVDSPAP